MAGDMHGEGTCVAGGACDGWHAWWGFAWQEVCMGECVAGVCVTRGGMRGRTDGHCSRWYASDWNAVLLNKYLHTFLLESQKSPA